MTSTIPLLITGLLSLLVTLSAYTQDAGDHLPSHPYHTLRGGLDQSRMAFEQTKHGRVAFLGGSITYNGGWRDSTCQYLRRRFPDTRFDFIAAGIPSMGSTPGAFRLERDVLSQGPVDLLFVEAAVNDATNGRTDTEQIRAMEGIIRHLRRDNPAADMLIMHFVDPKKMAAYRRGNVPAVIRNHERVAAHYDLPTINLAREVTERIDAGEFSWEDDFKDLHPSPFGQGVYARSMIEFLKQAWDGKAKFPATPHSLPTTIDPANYSHGKLVDVRQADFDELWEYISDWAPTDGKATRPNYVEVPMLVARKAGAELSFHFTGNAVGIAVAAGPDAGVLSYRIDEGPWQEQDLYTRWSGQLHLPWYYTLAAGLDEGRHTLALRLEAVSGQGQRTGNACRIRYFFVNESPLR